MFHELRQEHARFGRVLALIGRRAATWVDRPDPATLQLLGEAVDYVVNFQNRYHHPREDLVFRRIARRSAGHRAVLAALRRDHAESHQQGQRLLQELRRLEVDPTRRVRRAALARELQSFARNMRGHIRREDELMYSSAAKVLRATDWRALARSRRAPADPLRLARDGKQRRYAALAQYVAEGEAAATVGTRPTKTLEIVLSRWTQLADQGFGCARLLSRQAREAAHLGLASYAAAMRPRLPRSWGANVAASLAAQRRASARWIEEWRAQLGIETTASR